MCVQRQAARARQHEENRSHKHAVIGSRNVLHAPPASLKQDGNFSSGDRRANHRQQGNRGEARAQSHEHEQPANNFHRTHKRSHHVRRGNSNRHKSPRSPLIRKNKFLDSLQKKHSANHKTDGQDRRRYLSKPGRLPVGHASPRLPVRGSENRPRNGWSVTQSGTEKHLTPHWAMNYSVSSAVLEGRNNVAHRACPERSEGEVRWGNALGWSVNPDTGDTWVRAKR